MKEFVYPRRTPVIIPPPPSVRSSNKGGSTSSRFSMQEENSAIAPFILLQYVLSTEYLMKLKCPQANQSPLKYFLIMVSSSHSPFLISLAICKYCIEMPAKINNDSGEERL